MHHTYRGLLGPQTLPRAVCLFSQIPSVPWFLPQQRSCLQIQDTTECPSHKKCSLHHYHSPSHVTACKVRLEKWLFWHNLHFSLHNIQSLHQWLHIIGGVQVQQPLSFSPSLSTTGVHNQLTSTCTELARYQSLFMSNPSETTARPSCCKVVTITCVLFKTTSVTHVHSNVRLVF